MRSAAARALFEQATKEFHNPSAEANGPERARLLGETAQRYEQLLKEYPEELNLGAQALSAVAKRIELGARTASLDKPAVAVMMLENEFRRAKAALESLVVA